MRRKTFSETGALRHIACFAALVIAACSTSSEDDSDEIVIEEPVRRDGGRVGLPEAGGGGPSCANAVRDGDETDVDCGGAVCPACANGRACLVARDCVGRECKDLKCANDVGCSDGTREAFTSLATFPEIAGCSGGWSVAGLGTTTNPACARNSGNDSANSKGTDCNVADLCQLGWHVCATAAEVGARSGAKGCAGAGIAAGKNAFFAIRQSGPGAATCGAGTNDLFGCGDVGIAPDAVTCAPLDRFSNDLCAALPVTWVCGTNNADELNNVTKSVSDNGGVLCCRD